jgi:ribokinase
VKTSDTTAAGDTFNGALAAALANGNSLPDAVVFANAAAALSVTKPGAIASIPSLKDVQEFLWLQPVTS